jgi:hypothetical protein
LSAPIFNQTCNLDMEIFALFRTAISILVVLALVPAVTAESKDWTGDQGPDRSDPNNWDPPGVPGSADDVTISPDLPPCQMPDGDVNVNHIDISGQLNVGNCSVTTTRFNKRHIDDPDIPLNYQPP